MRLFEPVEHFLISGSSRRHDANNVFLLCVVAQA